MTTNDIRKLVSNNQLQQALNACEQLGLPDDFKSRLTAMKASYREYNDHRIYKDISDSQIETSRAAITRSILIFLSEYEIVCITDLKKDFVELADNIEQHAAVENEAVVEEAKQITNDLASIDNAEKKEDIKPGVIKRMGDFLAKFQDKDSAQGKVLTSLKDGVNVLQQLGKKYNSVAQWFALPQIPTVFL
jgi:hypothetical protein